MQFRLRRAIALAAALCAVPGASRAQPVPTQPLTEGEFRACVDRLAAQTHTARRPLSRADFARIARDATYQDRVRVAFTQQRVEPPLVWDEVAATTDDERVAAGKEVLERAASTLQAIEAKWGMPKEVLVAIYGIETDYGARAGRIPVLDAALTLACLRPCANEGRKGTACLPLERAYAAVRVIRDRHVQPETFLGSWAAAFGRTQFVPDTFEELAVDFDGDGRRDVIGSEADALASTARFIRDRGRWRTGLPMLVEVSVPEKARKAFESGGNAVRLTAHRKALNAWLAEGWQVMDAAAGTAQPALPSDAVVYPFAPVGWPGPVFLVTANFDAVLRYNPGSSTYALEVALLSRKLAGAGDFVTPWPTDDPGLSRAQIRELQQWLVEQGHDQVVVDGIVGEATRDAIAKEREKKGMEPGRRVGVKSMRELMGR